MKHYRLDIYVPESHFECVKNACLNAGAGRMGNYDMCCWSTRGTGEFRPCAGAKPFIGEANRIECVTEIKIEMIVCEDFLDDVIASLRKSHPYETPSFQYWEVKITGTPT